jgi:hypothetical protein
MDIATAVSWKEVWLEVTKGTFEEYTEENQEESYVSTDDLSALQKLNLATSEACYRRDNLFIFWFWALNIHVMYILQGAI